MTRIISGSKSGHRLAVPKGSQTRPTTDRVREALFSALSSWADGAGGPPEQALAGLSFCDLYAGSGAVGLEAASRGAAPVMLVEADKRTALIAAGNAKTLGLRAEVRATRVETALTQPDLPRFDIVFADPPYEVDSAVLDQQLHLVVASLLSADGLVVVERSSRSAPPIWPTDLSDHWHRSYGETTLYYAAQGGTA